MENTEKTCTRILKQQINLKAGSPNGNPAYNKMRKEEIEK